MSATVTIDHTVINSWVQPGGMVDANMERRSGAVLAEALQRVPYVTGALHDSGTTQRASDPQGAWDVIFAIYYAWYVDQGTQYFRGRFFLRDAVSAAIR